MAHVDDLRTRPAAPHHLGEMIRSHRDDIVARWAARVRGLPHASTLDQPRLVDHIPQLLDRIAEMTEALGQGRSPRLGRHASEQHALARLEEGFDIIEVISEFRVLRDVVFELVGEPVSIGELRVLDQAIDAAISDSVERYAEIRERTLQGFDRISAAVLESRDLDDLLRRLLQVLHATTPSIDTSSIYLREGDMLRARATVGLGREAEADLEMRVGDGFAGTIALRGEPMTVHHPSAEQLHSAVLASANLRVLYGVPLLEGGHVIGVAKIGSCTADEFSRQDERIFAAMVARASAAIAQHVLREQAQSATARLAESERELHALADNIPQLAWMADARGEIYWRNRRWYEFVGAGVDDPHHPDHRERVLEKYRRHVETGEPWEDTFPMRGRDGHYRWFLSRAVPIRNAAGAIERWFGTNTDVTARRFLDNSTKLLTSSLDYRETLERLARLAVPDLADGCIVDLVDDGNSEHVAVAEAQTTAPDLEGRTAEVMRTGIAQVAADQSWIAAPLRARGATIGVVHLLMCASGRRYTPEDVEVATELGQRAGAAVDNARVYRDAQVAVRVRDDVLAIVSHDLRNPLGAIDLGATLLLHQLDGEGDGDPRMRKHVETIRRSTDRMEHLIDDLLDMASINVGKFSMQCLHVDAAELLSEAIEMHEPLAAERGISILREQTVAGVTVMADRNRLIQAFANLMSNAIKFCRPGDVIMVRAEREGERVQLAVADTGPGIPKSELPHIFEPYWSGRAGRKKGTGLGLFITKAIVEAHGGELAVDSEEGRGASFVVTLPVATQ